MLEKDYSRIEIFHLKNNLLVNIIQNHLKFDCDQSFLLLMSPKLNCLTNLMLLVIDPLPPKDGLGLSVFSISSSFSSVILFYFILPSNLYLRYTYPTTYVPFSSLDFCRLRPKFGVCLYFAGIGVFSFP